MKYYLAVDIGASSGRHIIGYMEGGALVTREVFRFETGFVSRGGSLVNDVDALCRNVIAGIKRAFEVCGGIESIAIDTWGVDYVLMKGPEAVLPVYAYRDSRTEAVIDKVHDKVSFETLYSKTGVQFQPFNTVYQLCADMECGRLDGVTDFLMLPEYLAYRLTGVKMKEYTNATTTGLVNAASGSFDTEIISALGLPEMLFAPLHMPATTVGQLLPEVQREVGGNCKVVLAAGHDTASAVEGIPMEGNQPYISSGTWSLLGIKVPHAITDDASRKANYSNEGGVGYIRYQKNIMGMWVVNRLKEEIASELSFAEVVQAARAATCDSIVDVNAPAFFAPVSMKQAFDDAIGIDGITVGDYFRVAFCSLAESYRIALDELKRNTGLNCTSLYIVGGGAKNDFLNELTAQKCNVKVVALAIEATALGNLKVQMGDKL